MELEKQRRVSPVPIAASVIVLLLGLGWIAVIQFNTEKPEPRLPSTFVLAPGFTGKIKILYEVDGAPPLEIRDGHRVLPIPPSGQFETSSPMLYGIANDKFLRGKGDGEYEELGIQYLKMRKNGLVGDEKEYFENTGELKQRDEWLRKKGQVDAEGNVTLGGPYEMMIIRDDFE